MGFFKSTFESNPLINVGASFEQKLERKQQERTAEVQNRVERQRETDARARRRPAMAGVSSSSKPTHAAPSSTPSTSRWPACRARRVAQPNALPAQLDAVDVGRGAPPIESVDSAPMESENRLAALPQLHAMDVGRRAAPVASVASAPTESETTLAATSPASREYTTGSP